MNTVKKERKTYAADFRRGVASAFDLSGGAFPELPDFHDCSKGFERDREALAGDRQRIGNDMRKVMNQIAYEQ
jgi:hypothetical protein